MTGASKNSCLMNLGNPRISLKGTCKHVLTRLNILEIRNLPTEIEIYIHMTVPNVPIASKKRIAYTVKLELNAYAAPKKIRKVRR